MGISDCCVYEEIQSIWEIPVKADESEKDRIFDSLGVTRVYDPGLSETQVVEIDEKTPVLIPYPFLQTAKHPGGLMKHIIRQSIPPFVLDVVRKAMRSR